MRRNTKLSPLAEIAIAAIEDLKGQNITVLDVQPLTTVTDTMIVCTGTSNRHTKSLAQNVVERAKEAGHRPLGVEGMDQGEWVLVDLGGVVVHAMQVQARAFYQLEKLWAVAEPVALEPKVKKPKKAGAALKKAGTKSAAKKKAGPGSSAKKSAKKPAGKQAAAKKPAGKSAKPAKPSTARKPATKSAAKKPSAKRPALKTAVSKAPRKSTRKVDKKAVARAKR